MLQKTAYKCDVLVTAICIAAAVLIAAVFPLRLFRREVTFEGSGKPLVMSEVIDTDTVVYQSFTARYGRIGSIDIYVAEVTGGRYMDLQLYDSDGAVICHRYIDMAEYETPGYVRMQAGIKLNVGQQYMLCIRGRYSSLRLGMEPAQDNSGGNADTFFYGYAPHPSLRLQMAMHYDVPLSKGVSLLVIAAVAAVAAALCALLRAWFEKHPEHNGLVLVSLVTERTLYAVAGAFYLVLLLFTFPMKRFCDRPGEIAWLCLGIVTAAVATFYAIRRFCTEPEGGDKMASKDKLSAVFFALAIAYGCEYMNGVYNLMHSASERQMLMCLLFVVLLSFRTDMLVNRVNLVWGFVSGAGGLWYVSRNALHAASEQEAYQNVVVRCNVICVILAGLILASSARSIRAKLWRAKPLSRFGILTAVVICSLIVFSTSRVTEVALLVLCVTLYGCVGCNIPFRRFMRILVWGVNINFLLTAGFCLLFRAFQAFIFTRYGMVFHTVAVTGEYLSVITLVMAAQLFARLAKEPGDASLRMKIRHAWREVFLFSLSGVYALFTISRTAYLTIFTGILLLLVVFCLSMSAKEKGTRTAPFPKRFLETGLVLVCSCVLLFPGVFALQRILPAVTGRHVAIAFLEKNAMMPDLLGSARWDSTYYISGIRFWSIFRARILRQPELPYAYPEDRFNFNEYYQPVYDKTGKPVLRDQITENGSDAAADISDPDLTPVPEGTGESDVEISNGRLDIFRTYLSRMNLTGHGVLYTEDPDYVHAHNSYLQVMYTNGVPTGILFTIWVGLAVLLPLVYYRRAMASGREPDDDKDAYLITAGTSVAFAVAGLTEMNFQLCNPMCFLLFTGILPLIFRKEAGK